MSVRLADRLRLLIQPLRLRQPEVAELQRRLLPLERNLVLPAKFGLLAVVWWNLHYGNWFGGIPVVADLAIEYTRMAVRFYGVFLAGMGAVLLLARRLPFPVLQWAVYGGFLVDGVLLAALAVVTNGFDSIVYWLFIALLLRNAATLAPTLAQLILNLLTTLLFVIAGLVNEAIMSDVLERVTDPHALAEALNYAEPDLEQIGLRIAMLVFTALTCYGVQVLYEQQRVALEEAREFAAREAALHSAGRLAAQIAHQIKNPLAVINNSAFSLNRALESARPELRRHVEIISEEVERSDRILTQLMNYARLAEGHVEKLDVKEEVERAVREVFPPGGGFATRVTCEIEPHLPALVMQRAHLSEILVNLLKNAREAVAAGGAIRVTVNDTDEGAIVVRVSDDGPGIPPDRRERVFEAYYTTKPGGTGLGLPIVRHNAELYGGTVQLDSSLGKGATFTVVFPSKALV